MGRLIAERDVQRLTAGAKLVVERDAIVTPAARDLAHARGIELVRECGGTAPSNSAPSCGCAGGRPPGPGDGGGAWPKLADGDYLLEVRDGKVRARRIER